MIAHVQQVRSDAEATDPGMERSQREHRTGSWWNELQDVLRAVSGGFIFATPLLYTMEMWWIGTTAELWKLLLFLGVAALIGFGLARSRSGGFKEETSRFASVEQALDGIAVGLIGAVVVLTVLNRIQVSDPLDSILGKVIVQAVPLSIGAAVANAIFGPHGERSREAEVQFGGEHRDLIGRGDREGKEDGSDDRGAEVSNKCLSGTLLVSALFVTLASPLPMGPEDRVGHRGADTDRHGLDDHLAEHAA